MRRISPLISSDTDFETSGLLTMAIEQFTRGVRTVLEVSKFVSTQAFVTRPCVCVYVCEFTVIRDTLHDICIDHVIVRKPQYARHDTKRYVVAGTGERIASLGDLNRRIAQALHPAKRTGAVDAITGVELRRN